MIQAKSVMCGNRFVMFSNKLKSCRMMNNAPDSRLKTLAFSDFLLLTHSRESQPSYYMKLFDIHNVVVSISAWVSHAMPLSDCTLTAIGFMDLNMGHV